MAYEPLQNDIRRITIPCSMTFKVTHLVVHFSTLHTCPRDNGCE